ncbi:MAG: hypothetical protein PHX74_10335 [Candidatus Sumerlaeales bacterium]|nr:hypothetical protein [Candidatus Sumerlaeales bacterium]
MSTTALTSIALVPWALLRLGLIIVTCVGAGCWWPRVTLLRSHTLTAILYSAILGIGILGSLTAVLGYCHLLTLNFILPLAAASFASGVLYLLATIRGADHPIRMVADLRFMRRHIRHKRRSQSIRAVRRRVVPSDRWSWLHYSLFAVTAILLLYMLLGALAPDSQQDSQWYHLSVARAWVFHNTLETWMEVYPSNYALLDSAFYAFLLSLSTDSTNCTMAQWFFGALGISLTGVFAYEWFGRRASAWAVFLAATALTTTSWFVPMHTSNDLMVMMFMTAGLLLTIDELYGRPASDGLRVQPLGGNSDVAPDPFGMDRMAAIGLLLGFAVATKLSALGWAIPSWFLLVGAALFRRRGLPALPWRMAIYCCGWMGIPCIILLLRNTFIGCGNPIYPIARGLIPLRPGWEMLATRFTEINDVYTPTLTGLQAMLSNLPRHFSVFLNSASPQVVFTLVIALALLIYARRLPVAAALSVVGLAQWFVLCWLRGEAELVRQFGQTLSVIFVGGGFLLTRVEDSARFTRRIRLTFLLLLVALFAGNAVKRQITWGMMPANHWQWRPILSEADSLAYLRACTYTGPRIDLFRELNATLADDATVLVADGNFPFYLERKYYWCDDDLSYVKLLADREITDGAGVRAYLKGRGITHVVATPGTLPLSWQENLTTMTNVRAGCWAVK